MSDKKINPFAKANVTGVVISQKAADGKVGKKAGRPKKLNVKKYTISLPVSLHNELKCYARDFNCDISFLFAQIGGKFVKEQKSVKNDNVLDI